MLQLRPGDHVCVPGQDAGPAAAGLMAYVAGGLRDQQRVVVLAEDPSMVAATLATQVAGCYAAMERGQVLVRDRSQGYLTDGVFDADRLLGQLARTVDTAVAAGYTGLRVSGDPSIVLRAGVSVDALVEYEARANVLFTDRPLVAMCHYDPVLVGRDAWWRLAGAHPSTIPPVTGWWRRGLRLVDSDQLRCRRTETGLCLTGVVDLANHAALPGLLAGLAARPGACDLDATGLAVADAISAGVLLRAVIASDGRPTTLRATPSLIRLVTTLGAADIPGLHLVADR